jgi:cytochrome c oxidase subunit 2
MVNIFFVVLIIIGGGLGWIMLDEQFGPQASNNFQTQLGLGFLEAQSPVMEKIVELHDFLLWTVFLIPAFVLVILGYIAIRYSRKNNPVPQTFTHNTAIEILWTVIPVIILVVIAIPSIKLLYYMDKAVDAEMTLKITGYQWYWGYEYPDHDNIAFESIMIPDSEIDKDKGQIRLLETDNRVILPVGTDIRLLFTSADVIHAWGMPQLGLKIDAIPGRLNETWVHINTPGIYRGQCSELCGANHAYMPIVIEAVSKEDFEKWVEKAKDEFAGSPKLLNLASN